jgi:hypothetical protein
MDGWTKVIKNRGRGMKEKERTKRRVKECWNRRVTGHKKNKFNVRT